MNKFILSIFAAGVLFAVGHALKCYKCDIGIGDLCLTRQVTCNAGELCFSGSGKTAAIEIKMKGCLAPAECNKTTNVNFPSDSSTSIYSMTKTCCNMDLCNAAPGLARVGALPLAFATLTTLLLTRALV